jgi:hypothetical protein
MLLGIAIFRQSFDSFSYGFCCFSAVVTFDSSTPGRSTRIMLHRKLLEILSRLPAVDHKRLRLFLSSPYFNTGYLAPKLIELYDYVMEHQADEASSSLDKQKVAAVFYPEKPFREKEKGPIDHLASHLFQLVRDFLYQRSQDLKASEAKKLLNLAEFYREHSLEERFAQTMQGIVKTQAAPAIKDSEYFWLHYEIDMEIASFKSWFTTFEDDFNTTALHHNLDSFYTLLKLENLCTHLYEKTISKPSAAPNKALSEAVLHLPEDDPIMETPLARCYRLVYDLLDNEHDEDKLKALETLLDQHRREIPAEKFYNLQAYYRYFWNRLYASRGINVTEQIFNLYKHQLETGSLYNKGQIHTTVFRVMIQFSLRNKAYDWTKEFFTKHQPEMISGTRYPQEFYNLNYAEYHFARKEYDAASEKLNFLSFENTYYSLQVDVLLIKIYFETQDELLEPRMRAFEQRVRRSRVGPEFKERYFNFLKKLDKIIKYGWQKNSPKRQKLIEEIRTASAIVEREWLLEKLG